MKVHQHFPRGFWDLHLTHNVDSSSCNRRLPQNDAVAFVSPTYLPQDAKKPTPQVETQAGGTRWNPTQEQIGILEMLYSRGMRTPNSHQIEQIAVQLSKFGRIEGKNVFYWFQNHKARERQKLKRLSPPNTASFLSFDASSKENSGTKEHTTSKRKCTSWAFENIVEESSYTLNNELADPKWDTEGKEEHNGDKKTLELFPLHPEGK